MTQLKTISVIVAVVVGIAAIGAITYQGLLFEVSLASRGVYLTPLV